MSYWPETQLTLECFPRLPEHVSMPWDAADSFLSRQLDRHAETLIINDRHGALACSFKQHQSWCDSACAIAARINNLQNNFPADEIQAACTDNSNIDWIQVKQVAIKIPKNFDQLKYWLHHCQNNLPDNTPIYLAGMAKHIPVSWLNWLETHCGQYHQSRIEKKARLLTLSKLHIPAPKKSGYRNDSLKLDATPGVFSGNKLDIGSRVILPYLTVIDQGTVCDLGCGNGLLGLTIKQNQPHCRVIATDDSYVATQSAMSNAKTNQLEIEVRHGNCLAAVSEQLDWVVCNPPYHDGHKELTNIAINMFRESQQRLSKDGQMLIVANRHLPYQKELTRLFKHVDSIHKDNKFTIFHCKFPKH